LFFIVSEFVDDHIFSGVHIVFGFAFTVVNDGVVACLVVGAKTIGEVFGFPNDVGTAFKVIFGGKHVNNVSVGVFDAALFT